MDSETEFYEYDIPEWFQRAWAWLLKRYPNTRKGPSDQTYWHNFRGLHEGTLKKAIVKATEDDPDKFPECKRILGIYNATMGSNFKKRYERKLEEEHGPYVPPTESQMPVVREYFKMLQSIFNKEITLDEARPRTLELMKEYKAAEHGLPAREEELQIEYQDEIPFGEDLVNEKTQRT